MPAFDRAYFSIGHLDLLSYQDTFMHRLDPRVKIIVTAVFVLTVVSFPKHELSGLIPFFIFPVFIFSSGDIPAGFILKKVFLVSPFAIFIGIFNPLLDTGTMYRLLGTPISGGWISFLSIILKFLLTISAALLLIATTSFPGVCYGLQRLGIPDFFVSQLLFLYRYIFVLMEETMRIVRAHDVRSFDKKGRRVKTVISLTGMLFIRTIERSERIYRAMLSRGFTGKIITSKSYGISSADVVFMIISFVVFSCFRRFDVTEIFGNFAKGFL